MQQGVWGQCFHGNPRQGNRPLPPCRIWAGSIAPWLCSEGSSLLSSSGAAQRVSVSMMGDVLHCLLGYP